MADQIPTSDAGVIQWTKATSKNGAPFEIATPGEAEQSSETKSATRTGCKIYWRVGDSQETSQEVKEMGISRYQLSENPPSHFYRYALRFTTTTGLSWNHWRFTDETENIYTVITMRDGNQGFQYNSENPTLIYVEGP